MLLSFHGMITVSVCVEQWITEVIVPGIEVYIPHLTLSLNLNLPNLGLTQPVLVLYMIERLPTKKTRGI